MQGVQPHPQSFDLVKIRKKSGNLGKMCENVRKIAACASILQKWHRNESGDVFFWRSYFYLAVFGKVRRNLGKNNA